MVGALLTPGKRTVTAALRVLGLAQYPYSERDHRVLYRATWSGLAVSRILLWLLVTAFVPDGPLIIGSDETLERRRGAKHPHAGTRAKGIYRDPVRSSRTQFVTSRGLRWVCLMLLAPIPWASRVWALPFLTVLAPSARYDQTHQRQHTTLIDWARQLLRTVWRWHPDRAIVAVADSTDAALDLLATCRTWATPVTAVVRFRLDAAPYAPALPGRPGQVGRPHLKGPRLPTLARVARDPMTVWTSLTVAS